MIAVREMNIPKNCEECKFCINQKTNDYGSFGECLLQTSRVNCLNSSRDTDCPLVEIVTCKDYAYCKDLWCEKDSCVVSEDYYCGGGEKA